MNPHIIAPSVLATDFTHLAADIELLNKSEAEWIHIDVMDGHFVPNISFGMPILKAIRSLTKKVCDVHLMISEPGKYIEDFAQAGADVLTVHYEACPHLHRTIQQIKQAGMKAGVAINPHTSVDLLDDVLEDVDVILVMSVNPGFGGQKFIYRTLQKVRALKDKIETRNLSAVIEVDGGVGLQNAESLLKAGARVLVAGSSVFKSDSPLDTISQLQSIPAQTTWA